MKRYLSDPAIFRRRFAAQAWQYLSRYDHLAQAAPSIADLTGSMASRHPRLSSGEVPPIDTLLRGYEATPRPGTRYRRDQWLALVLAAVAVGVLVARWL